MPQFLRIAKGVGVGVGIAAYAALVHRENATGHQGALAAFLAVLPLLLVILAMMAKPGLRWGAFLLLITGAGLFWLGWPQLAQHAGVLFWLQDMALLLALLTLFGRTLLPGNLPLCVKFAQAMHGELSVEHVRYARQVTWAWTVFFGLLALVSTTLFFLTPLVVWSLYANFTVLPLIGIMFIVEYQVRKRVLTNAPHGRFIDAIHAYLDSSRRSA
jgi:uncharacterized membrane protein